MSKRIWEVREGGDGRGPVLIHVYADEMASARSAARRNLPDSGHYLAHPEYFTVHAVTEWSSGPDAVTLATAGLPMAPDFPDTSTRAA